MKEDEKYDEKILDVICKFYKFDTVSYNFQGCSNGIFLKTIKNDSVVTVSRNYDQYTYQSHYSFFFNS